MSTAFGIAAGEAESFAHAARAAIDARLSLLPDDELRDYWTIVAKLCARGVEQTATTLIDAVVGPEPDA
ncbi:hypothetical protein [Methylobacterium durans]|uniref:Uncharacterized protein n=1 Tax=Methylobacterium durans TaxID=2202825 RepID=A0A2U8WB61_9HYPH|nr:hypothetical protein [Methylobacterium durans]AWN42680.1 hypothetical protein DK389_21970 [Methylobacterium durans]